MNYEDFVKNRYMKKALKGAMLPFSEKWEGALVAVQCIFAINSNLQTQAAKLVDGVPDAFNDDFSSGKPIRYGGDAGKYLSFYLRAQNLMRTARDYLNANLTTLDKLIIPNKDKIDIGIYKYYIGNKEVLSVYASELTAQIVAIDASVQASFGADESVKALKASLMQIFDRTREDLTQLTLKFGEATKLANMLKVG